MVRGRRMKDKINFLLAVCGPQIDSDQKEGAINVTVKPREQAGDLEAERSRTRRRRASHPRVSQSSWPLRLAQAVYDPEIDVLISIPV